MKKLLLYNTLLFLGAFGLFFFFLKSMNVKIFKREPAHTVIKINKSIIDVGDKTPADLIQARFVIYNVGKEELKIQSVEPDCHCTVADFSGEAVKPGDSVVVVLQHDGKTMGLFQSSA